MIGNVPKYWKRTGYVSIEGNDRKMHNYGGSGGSLDFKFDGKVIGNIYTEFSVGILGLTRETINELTVWNPSEAFDRRRRIKVFAGYEGDKLDNPIFDGFVMDAIPTNPPEMWLNFHCMKYFDLDEPIVGVEPVKNEPAEEVVKQISSILNLEYGADSWRTTTLDRGNKISFHFNCSKLQVMVKFSNEFGVALREIDGKLIVDDQRPWITHADDPVRSVLSTETGLLNIGNITMIGLSATRRLDNSSKLFEWIGIDSKFIPKLGNDSYYVMSKHHKGHFRGNEWMTTLECRRRYANI